MQRCNAEANWLLPGWRQGVEQLVGSIADAWMRGIHLGLPCPRRINPRENSVLLGLRSGWAF